MLASWRKALTGGSPVCVLLSVALLSTACSTETPEPGAVIVGSGDDMMSELLARIYAGAIESSGTVVEVEPGLGGRSDYLAALDAGDVSLVPDFTGALLSTFDTSSSATDAEDVFVDLNRSLPEGLSVGDYALAEDRPTVAVSAAVNAAGISTLSALAPTCAQAVLGSVDYPGGSDVNTAIAQVDSEYGCIPVEVRSYRDADSAVDAVTSGDLDALFFGTASLGSRAADLTTLEDDASILRAQNVVPLMAAGALDDAAYATLSVVAGELTTADLADMVDEVRGGAESGDVAVRWLGEHNL